MTVLNKKIDQVENGFPMGVVLNKKETKGDVGLEIEVEGKKLPHSDVPYKYWQHHIDHSLRGAENAEYVLKNPVAFDVVPKALDELWGQFDTFKSTIDESNRTSVHVHMNVQQFHLNRLTSFMALYFCFEEILTEWCGDHRVGNLFCLRAKDAPAIISQIRRFIKSDGKTELRDNLHYAGMNAHALSKFGSIEIRTLRGVADKQVILDWVGILERLYTLSKDYADPREICHDFSAYGPAEFFVKILGDKADTVRAAVPWNSDRIAESMLEGIRLAQDLCYCRDWTLYKGIEIKRDPFGRDVRKLANKIAGLAAMPEGAWAPSPYQPATMPSFAEYANILNATAPHAVAMNVQVTATEVPTWLDDGEF